MKPVNKCTTVFLILTFLIAFRVNGQDLGTMRITYLKAQSRNGNVGITWKTDKEENLRQYEIESSSDGRNYKNLGFIPPANNINGDVYQFENTVDYTDSAFYRLKIVDANGKWLYTEPILYKINKTTAFLIYPSVINSHMMNVFLNEGFDFIEVINMNGEVLLKQNLSGKTGKVSIPFSPDISGGIYVIQLRNESTTITQKIVVQ